MNEIEGLETQLRSWAPRRPSARLKRRLFGRVGVSATAEPHVPFRFSWLVPAAAAFLLTGVLFYQPNSHILRGSDSGGPLAGLILSNRSGLPYLPAAAGEVNNVPVEIFEWTNGGGFTSSGRSLSQPRVTH